MTRRDEVSARPSLCASLRLAWARHLLATAGRLENRARQVGRISRGNLDSDWVEDDS